MNLMHFRPKTHLKSRFLWSIISCGSGNYTGYRHAITTSIETLSKRISASAAAAAGDNDDGDGYA